METSEQVDEIFAALALAQGELKPALKTAVNDAFKNRSTGKGSTYATLHDCVTTAHPTLSKHGLAIINGICGHEFVARVAHKSGQWVQTRIPLPGNVGTIQQLMACQTYLRRASYSLVGLSTDDDDDGNEAAKAGTYSKPVTPGIGVHSPLGDVEVNDEARAYAESFKTAVDPAVIVQLAADLKEEGEEVYRAVWSLLDSKTRSSIKRILDAAKEPKAA